MRQLQAAAGAGGGAQGKRDYDKPWLKPEKKKEAETFLEHCYPNGDGPDADLIQMLE